MRRLLPQIDFKKLQTRKRSCSRNCSCRSMTAQRLVGGNHITVTSGGAATSSVKSPLNEDTHEGDKTGSAAVPSLDSRGRSFVCLHASLTHWFPVEEARSPHMTSACSRKSLLQGER